MKNNVVGLGLTLLHIHQKDLCSSHGSAVYFSIENHYSTTCMDWVSVSIVLILTRALSSGTTALCWLLIKWDISFATVFLYVIQSNFHHYRVLYASHYWPRKNNKLDDEFPCYQFSPFVFGECIVEIFLALIPHLSYQRQQNFHVILKRRCHSFCFFPTRDPCTHPIHKKYIPYIFR